MIFRISLVVVVVVVDLDRATADDWLRVCGFPNELGNDVDYLSQRITTNAPITSRTALAFQPVQRCLLLPPVLCTLAVQLSSANSTRLHQPTLLCLAYRGGRSTPATNAGTPRAQAARATRPAAACAQSVAGTTRRLAVQEAWQLADAVRLTAC